MRLYCWALWNLMCLAIIICGSAPDSTMPFWICKRPEIRAPEQVTLQGPDGLQATMTRAVLNIETFALSTDADVLVFSDGSVSLSATNGMDLDVRTGELTLRGAASAQIPPVLPDLE